MILSNETYDKFGYHPSDLKPKSHKKILAKCNDCGKIRILPKYAYKDLCISCTLKKIERTEERNLRISQSLRGKTFSEERKHNQSIAHKGQHSSLNTEFKNGNVPWNLGISPSDKTKQRISKSVIAKNIKGENHPMYGKHHSEVSKEKNRIAHLGKRDSKETKEKKRKKALGNWQKPEYAQKVLKAEHKLPNKAEQKLDILLQKILPKEYKYVGDGQVIIQGKCPDFINTNGQKKIIEFFGRYWHSEDDEANRKFIFNLFGYETLIVWEEELKDINNLQSKLLEFNNK